MVNILTVILCIMVVFAIVLILFLYFENERERKEQQQDAIELLEGLQLKVFLLKTDLTDFAERNNLLQLDFFNDFTFTDCIASIIKIESECTDPGLLTALKSTKRKKRIDSILSDCRHWMLYIDRISSSLETKSRNRSIIKSC